MPQSSHQTQKLLDEQLPEIICQQWEQDILPLLPADYEHAARSLGAYQRQRAVRSAADLLRALLAFVLCTSSLRHLGAWALLIKLADISHVAWHKRLQRSRNWFHWLLIHLLALPTPVSTEWGYGAARVVLVDATRLKQPGGCGDDWRVHLAYDVLHARLVDVHVSDRHTAEGFTLFPWLPDDLVVADRGYSRRPQVAWVLHQGAHIVVRMAVKQFPLLDASGASFDVISWLRSKRTGRFERCVSFVHEQHTYKGRLIVQSLSKQAAEKARAKLRRKANKNQWELQEDTLMLAGWLILFTSLPRQTWSQAQVLRLYRARWQIELVIKRMKQVLKLAQLRGKTPQSNEASIFALLVAWALQQQQANEARQVIGHVIASLNEGEQSPPTISSWAVNTLSIQTLRMQVQGYWTVARLRSCWPRLARFLWSCRKRRLHQESTIRQALCLQFGLDPSLLFSCSSA
jgi:hypothetical protein